MRRWAQKLVLPVSTKDDKTGAKTQANRKITHLIKTRHLPFNVFRTYFLLGSIHQACFVSLRLLADDILKSVKHAVMLTPGNTYIAAVA